MRKRYWRIDVQVFLLLGFGGFCVLHTDQSFAMKKEADRHQKWRQMAANPHFQQAQNPVNETKQNPPLDLPNTDRFNAEFSRASRRELQQDIRARKNDFEQDIGDFQATIKEQAEEMKDLLALAEVLTSVSKGEQKP